jgi:hypothetical protein
MPPQYTGLTDTANKGEIYTSGTGVRNGGVRKRAILPSIENWFGS